MYTNQLPLELDPVFLQIDMSLNSLEARRRELAKTVERAWCVLEDFRRRKEREREDLQQVRCSKRIVGV